MPITEPTSLKAAGCCPTLSPCGSCDELDFIYRMPFPTVVQLPGGGQQHPVEVTIRFRLERCSGPLMLGGILYSTTLQPGEQVRLASSDRHTRFSFDSDTQLSSRQYTTSEESSTWPGWRRRPAACRWSAVAPSRPPSTTRPPAAAVTRPGPGDFSIGHRGPCGAGRAQHGGPDPGPVGHLEVRDDGVHPEALQDDAGR